MPKAPDHRPLSEVLREVADEERVSVGELIDRFGGRALGALLLIFGLACTLPLPPGGTTVFGLPLVLLGPQLLFGARAPWIPQGLRGRDVPTADLKKGLPRVLPWLERAEAVSKPRLHFLFGSWGQRLIGLICSVLAIVLILPIPLGNLLPGAAVSVLALALVQRDGALALVGYALTAASAGVLVLAAGLIARGLGQVLGAITAA
ncbi:exopolysaccharide biosynthesis protein [Phenylobacterium soli]|uniref:Exopolysaccharide biosynthesis protein n=1 Tax=Phenylobacterium soli TaxID=2170551 RepID=A0A328AEX2_9CAUL|nr:exopolysaccharide biosynthesis protein [Phenylobacterium soli]